MPAFNFQLTSCVTSSCDFSLGLGFFTHAEGGNVRSLGFTSRRRRW